MEVRQFQLELREPLQTATGSIKSRQGWLIRIPGDPPGFGEATPLPGWTESANDCRQALETARSTLDATDEETALEAISDAPAARHGLDLALADRDAREGNISLARYLSGRDPDRPVPVNATIDANTPEALTDDVATALEAGYDCLKIKVGHATLAADVDRVNAVGSVIGDDIHLRADANGQWTRKQAEQFIDQIDVELDYLEQPLGDASLSEHAALREQIEIALDESVSSQGIASIISASAADVVVLKPMVLGGLDRTLSIARRARSQDIDVVITTTMDAVLARTAAIQLAGAIEPDRHCGLATADRLMTDLAPDPCPIRTGSVRVPSGPGLGVTPNWDDR